MTLPSPGPGRPQHPSYSEPSVPESWGELVFLVLVGPALIGLRILAEGIF